MKKSTYFFGLLISLLFSAPLLHAQKITGTWEGIFDGQTLIISIEQKDTMLCGFTHDFVNADSSDNCTAAYSGSYIAEQNIYLLDGNRFIENSGSHILMYIALWPDARLGKRYLRGKIFTGSVLARMTGMGGSNILMRKISERPIKLPGGEPNCFPKPKPVPKPQPVPVKPATPKPTPVKPATPKPQPTKPKPVQPNPTPAKKDSVKKISPRPEMPVVTKRDIELTKDMSRRKQTEQSRLEVNVKQINLKVYDNGVVDNDTVSIFYNGKLLLSHQRLSESPIVINLDLDENVTEHKIVMYAENLGGIPPNTALIVVTAGDKRYELRSKASLEENAVLIFDYRPK